MGLAVLLCLQVFTLHLNIFNFQRVNVGVSLGFCRVSEGFPEVYCKFSWVSAGFLGFPQGFRAFCAGVHGFCMGFCMVSAEFRRCRAVFNLRKVFQGFCRFPWLEDLPVCRTSSQQKLEKSYHGRCAALRQIICLCRDHFWSQKKVEFR